MTEILLTWTLTLNSIKHHRKAKFPTVFLVRSSLYEKFEHSYQLNEHSWSFSYNSSVKYHGKILGATS